MRTPRFNRRGGGRSGQTVSEVMIAATIGLAVAGFTAYVSLFSAKSQFILMPQMARQTSAAQGLQKASDLLRNCYALNLDGSSAMTISSSQVDFSTPLTPGVTSRLDFVGSSLVYYPDKDNAETRLTIAKNLESVTFSVDNGSKPTILTISASFKYRRYGGYNSGEGERLNGTFTTKIDLRNQRLT